MSVINQALRELERRAATEPSGTLPGRIRAVGARGMRGLRWTGIAAAVVVAAGAGRMFAPAAAGHGELPAQHAPVRVAPPEDPVEVATASTLPPLPPLPSAAPVSTKPAVAPASPKPSSRKIRATPVTFRPVPAGETHDWTLPEAALPEPVPIVAATRPVTMAPAKSGQVQAVPVEAIARQDRPMSANDRAQNEFLAGMAALRRGHGQEAEARLRAALEAQPGHLEARRALLGVLIEAQRLGDAEALMLAGLRAVPSQVSFAMVAARLQAQRGDAIAAIVTLEGVAQAGRDHPDFIGLHAGLLQRVGKHDQAAERYAAAIALGGPQAVWHIGRGVSLRELGRTEEARASFQRALDLGVLTPELRAYAERQVGSRRAG
jgi:MSHA biogenesis protein MshN